MSNSDNKVAIITGGTGILGGVMAIGLAKQGAKVAIFSNHD